MSEDAAPLDRRAAAAYERARGEHGRLRERRPGRRGPRHLERDARVARGGDGPALPAARVRRGSLPGQVVAQARALQRGRAGRDRRVRRRAACSSSASRWAARSRSPRPPTIASRACSGSRRGSSTGSTSSPLEGKRLDVLHGSLDRWLPGIPGVSASLSRRGFERARALGVPGSYTLIRGGLHGLALRSPGGMLVPLPRARRLGAR